MQDLETNQNIDGSEMDNKVNETQELTEAELSAVAGSLASICKKYITGSFFDKLAAAYGISQAKDILLGDVKNILGHGTAKNGQAALAFINGIKRANNQVKVDQILTNVMLAGDGMSNKIGYAIKDSQDVDKMTGFRAYLAEKAKNKDKKDEEGCGKQCDERLCVSDKEVEEAKAIVEAMGFKVIDPSEAKTEEAPKVDEGKGCCGGKKDKKKFIKESATEYVVVDCGGTKADPQGVKDLIDDAIATGAMDQAADAVIDIVIEGEKVLIYTEDPSTEFFAEVRRGVEKFLENAPGIEAEVGEDTIDDWKLAFDNSVKAMSDLVGESENKNGAPVNEKTRRIGKIRLLAQEKLRQALIDLDKDEYDYWMNEDPFRMRERIELYAQRMIDDPNGLPEDYAQQILDSM